MNKIYYLVFLLTVSLSSCTDNSDTEPILSSTNEITSFKLLSNLNSEIQNDYGATISNNEISISLPYNTDITELIATFETNANNIEVNGVSQVSSVTPNDFTNPLTYSAIAENNDVNNYVVIINIEEPPMVTAQNAGIVNSTFINSFSSNAFGWGTNLTGNTTQNFNSIDITNNIVYVVGNNGAFYSENINRNSINQYTIDLNIGNIDTKKTTNFLYVLTENALLRSSNNGQNFEKLTYSDFSINQLHISTDNNIYNFYNGKLWKSTDNGNTFTAINSNLPFDNSIISKGFYIDNNNTFWVISAGKIYQSQNEGTSFSTYNSTSLTSDYNIIFVSPDNNVWVGNYAGILGKSVNAGESFNLLDLTSLNSLATSIHDIKFSSNNIWVAVGNGNSGLVKISYDASNINGVYSYIYGTGINNDLAIDENGNIWSAESGAIGKNLQNLF